MTAFRVYYEGGATYDGDPWGAPGLGVLVIVESDPDHGRRLVTGGDYYVWREERWWSVDWIGMIDYLLQPGPRKVLIGRITTNEIYRDTYIRADSDPDFPARTAYGCMEKRLND